MSETIFNCLLSCCHIKGLLNQIKQLSSCCRCILLNQAPENSLHMSKHGLDGELYAIRHFGGRREVVAVFVNRNISCFTDRNVSAIDGGASLWLPPVNLGPMVRHGVARVAVLRNQEHGIGTVRRIAANCPAQFHVVLVVKPFICAALMEVIPCKLSDCWQGSESEPFLELHSNQPTRACSAAPLHRETRSSLACAGDRARSLTSTYIRTMADRAMTTAVKAVCKDPKEAPAYTERLTFRCSCNSGRCFKAMKVQSVLRAKTLQIQCPGHEAAATHSSLTEAFAGIIFAADSSAVTVWDLHCVQSRPRMSIDACVLSGGRWHCFEIDGPIHFLNSGTSRNDEDTVKDDAMNASGMRMLRLHHKDREEWPQYVHTFLQSKSVCVKYTKAYKECCGGEVDDANIMAL